MHPCANRLYSEPFNHIEPHSIERVKYIHKYIYIYNVLIHIYIFPSVCIRNKHILLFSLSQCSFSLYRLTVFFVRIHLLLWWTCTQGKYGTSKSFFSPLDFARVIRLCKLFSLEYIPNQSLFYFSPIIHTNIYIYVYIVRRRSLLIQVARVCSFAHFFLSYFRRRLVYYRKRAMTRMEKLFISF